MCVCALDIIVLLNVIVWPTCARAQRADENVNSEAEDGFGKSVGSESIGIYASGEVRGFSATSAGNNRIEGIYFDRQASVAKRIVRGSTVRLGLSSFGHPFAAPTGVVDLDLRRVNGRAVASVEVDSGDYFGVDYIFDGAVPVTDNFDVNLDLGLFDDKYVYGGDGKYLSYGGVVRWRPYDGVEATGFYGRIDINDEEQEASIFTAGPYLPRRVERRRYFGQEWADVNGYNQNFGGFIKATSGKWQLRAGIFRSSSVRGDYASPYVKLVDENGIGYSYLIVGRDQTAVSTSGEIRASRVFRDGRRKHRLLVAVRGRSVDSAYGGFSIQDFGLTRIGVPAPIAESAVATSPLTHDRVRQYSYAVGYEMSWPGIGEMNLGVTNASYRKSVEQPNSPLAAQRDGFWLRNAALALTPSSRLTVYAATTSGLEENGIAPANASNRGVALPALRTLQYEAGLRYAFGRTWKLQVAGFQISKPYFEIDQVDGSFRQLGQVTHRGIEGSLSGQPLPGFNLVVGAVALRPRVMGQAVEDGRLGKRPIGRAGVLIDVAADYRLPNFPSISFDTHIAYEGARVANSKDTLQIPSRAVIDIGARYRFRIAGKPTLLRLQVKNLFDKFGWKVSSGGGFTLLPGRRAMVSLTSDL